MVDKNKQYPYSINICSFSYNTLTASDVYLTDKMSLVISLFVCLSDTPTPVDPWHILAYLRAYATRAV